MKVASVRTVDLLPAVAVSALLQVSLTLSGEFLTVRVPLRGAPQHLRATAAGLETINDDRVDDVPLFRDDQEVIDFLAEEALDIKDPRLWQE